MILNSSKKTQYFTHFKTLFSNPFIDRYVTSRVYCVVLSFLNISILRLHKKATKRLSVGLNSKLINTKTQIYAFFYQRSLYALTIRSIIAFSFSFTRYKRVVYFSLCKVKLRCTHCWISTEIHSDMQLQTIVVDRGSSIRNKYIVD